MKMTLTPYERKLKATLPPQHWQAYCDGVLKVMLKREEAREAKQLKERKRTREFQKHFARAANGGIGQHPKVKTFHSFSALFGGGPSHVTAE